MVNLVKDQQDHLLGACYGHLDVLQSTFLSLDCRHGAMAKVSCNLAEYFIAIHHAIDDDVLVLGCPDSKKRN